MGTRIIHSGIDPGGGVLAALTGNGYEVDACGASIPKLKQVLQQRDDLDAIAVTENATLNTAEITIVHSLSKAPLILFQDDSGTCDPSQFDLVIPEHPPSPDLLKRISELIERNQEPHASNDIP